MLNCGKCGREVGMHPGQCCFENCESCIKTQMDKKDLTIAVLRGELDRQNEKAVLRDISIQHRDKLVKWLFQQGSFSRVDFCAHEMDEVRNIISPEGTQGHG